jgi:uncharacterized protein
MQDLIVAFGLVFVIEGLLWAAFPQMGLKLLEIASISSEQHMRWAGAVAIGIGVFIVWLVRG